MGILYDIASGVVGQFIKEGDTDNMAKSVKSGLGKINAITKMAKSAIFSYPVLVSEEIVANDEELMFAICAYLETQYAIFTMISMGLNPVLEKGATTKSYLSSYYSEEGDDSMIIPGLEPVCEVSLSDENIPVTENDLIEYNKAYTADDVKDGSSTSKEGVAEDAINAVNEKIKNRTGVTPVTGEDDSKISRVLSVDMDKLEKKVRISDPTIVKVKLKMKDVNQSDIEFPIAVKAMPRFITTDESSQIFTYLKEDRPLVSIVRLLSGEIKLFRDIILQLQRAEKDKNLYAKLGRHPWFRQLITRRNDNRINSIAQLIPPLENFVKGRNDNGILPICSLVVTKNEIEKGFSNLWANIKKQDESIMDKLMLLCLCIVDTTTNIVEFDFYGLKNNVIMKTDSLIRETKSKDDKDLEKLLQTLVYKI